MSHKVSAVVSPVKGDVVDITPFTRTGSSQKASQACANGILGWKCIGLRPGNRHFVIGGIPMTDSSTRYWGKEQVSRVLRRSRFIERGRIPVLAACFDQGYCQMLNPNVFVFFLIPIMSRQAWNDLCESKLTQVCLCLRCNF
jgi:hypothetical protein